MYWARLFMLRIFVRVLCCLTIKKTAKPSPVSSWAWSTVNVKDIDVEMGGRGDLAPLDFDFENFSRKDCFISSEWEKTNLTTFGSLKKFGGSPLVPLPLEKILPTPMVEERIPRIVVKWLIETRFCG